MNKLLWVLLLAIVNFTIWIYSVVPRAVADHWGRTLGRIMYYLIGSKRRVARDALEKSYPDWDNKQIKRVIKGVFRTQGLFVSEILRLMGNAKPTPIDIIDCGPGVLHEIDECKRLGKGLLVLTAHINNYELLLAWAAHRYPLSVITKQIKQPELDNLLVKLRERNNIRMLPKRGSFRDAVRELKSGRVLGFVLDQNMKKKHGIHVTFFDRPACTTPGLAMMSAHAGVPVLPVCIFREGDRYTVKSYPLIKPPADRKPETLQAATQEYSNVVESMIREQPEGWIWIHKRWRTPPVKGDRITLPDGSSYHA